MPTEPLDSVLGPIFGVTVALSGRMGEVPYALLGSSFEQVLLVDADVTFLQPPELILLDHTQYQDAGMLLFHDRLI